jgi:hypothetical protein
MQVCFIPKAEVMSFFDTNNQFSMNVNHFGDLKDADGHMVNMVKTKAATRRNLLYLEDTL